MLGGHASAEPVNSSFMSNPYLITRLYSLKYKFTCVVHVSHAWISRYIFWICYNIFCHWNWFLDCHSRTKWVMILLFHILIHPINTLLGITCQLPWRWSLTYVWLGYNLYCVIGMDFWTLILSQTNCLALWWTLSRPCLRLLTKFLDLCTLGKSFSMICSVVSSRTYLCFGDF